MSAQQPATPLQLGLIAAGAGAAGLYLMLVGLALLPVPGGPRSLHGPLWIVLVIGLVLTLAGLAMLVQLVGRANASGELPSEAPFWLRVVQYLIGVVIFASFAMIGSWIALGGEASSFSGSFLVFDGATNAAIGRIAFGIGALIAWLATIRFAIAGARKLIRCGKT